MRIGDLRLGCGWRNLWERGNSQSLMVHGRGQCESAVTVAALLLVSPVLRSRSFVALIFNP